MADEYSEYPLPNGDIVRIPNKIDFERLPFDSIEEVNAHFNKLGKGLISAGSMEWPPSTVLTPERLAAQEEENKRMRSLLDNLNNSDETES